MYNCINKDTLKSEEDYKNVSIFQKHKVKTRREREIRLNDNFTETHKFFFFF